MKKIYNGLLAILLIFSNVFTVSASANATNGLQVDYYQVGELGIASSYEINEEAIIEESRIYKDGQEITMILKKISLDGTIRVFQNDILVKTGVGDYETFLSAAEGKSAIIIDNVECEPASTIYYPCGRTEYHEQVSKTTESINVGIQTSVENAVIMLFAQLLLPSSGVAALVGPVVNTALETDAEYIDVTETKYFIYNSTAQISMNCYHLYLVYYDTIGGSKKVVKTEWKFYQQVL